MLHPRPTRRAVVGAAAWSAPAVVVLAAAPAFAASTTPAPPTFTATTGRTRYAAPPPAYGGDDSLRSVVFNGFSITPSASSPNLLWMTVTQSFGAILGDGSAPQGWYGSSSTESALVYTWLGPVQAGVPIAFGPAGIDTAHFDDGGSRASFTLTIQSPTFTPLTLTYRP